MESTFSEFAILLLISAVAGAVAVRLRQQLLVAYIIVGILVSPAVFGFVRAEEQVALLAQVGITVLLFVVGLKLDLHHVRNIGPVALATGLGQLTFTILIGFLLSLALGMGSMEALYIAVALTFSSTIIIVKLLSDKRELDALHGRIAVGFLIVQDIAVVVAMMVMSTFGAAENDLSGFQFALSLAARLVGSGLVVFVLMRYILPRVLALLASSQELLLIFAIALGTAMAASGEVVGFSKEAGAFLAGFTLASTEYREAISARLTSIRDFLLLFFFIDLGTHLDFTTIGGQVYPALVLASFVLIGNPLIVMAIMGYMGYRKRTGFLAGLTVAQISEFSIIFVAMGITIGHVSTAALGLTTLVGLITIMLSTYMILYAHPLYDRLAPWLTIFERRTPFRELAVEQEAEDELPPEIVIFGQGRYGSRLARQLHEAGLHVLGVDFDPEVVRNQRAAAAGEIHIRFGDGEDPDCLDTLPLLSAKWIAVTLPQLETTRILLNYLAEKAFAGQIAVVVRDENDRGLARFAGSVRTLYPFTDAADHAARILARDVLQSLETKPKDSS